MTKQIKKITLSLATALLLLSISIVILPAGWLANDGFSYFGAYWPTAMLFVTAMAIYIYTLRVAFKSLQPLQPGKYLVRSYKIMLLSVVGLTIIPISIHEDLHSIIGLFLFIAQLAVSAMLLRQKFSWIDATLVAIQAGSLTAGLYYAFFEYGLLLQMQFIFQAAFWAHIVRYISKHPNPEAKSSA